MLNGTADFTACASKQAIEEHAPWRGKVVNVSGAYVGNGDCSLGYREFTSPVTVKIDEEALRDAELSPDRDSAGELVDAYYPASLAGSHSEIRADEHVVWIDGPTYHADGAVDRPAWMG